MSSCRNLYTTHLFALRALFYWMDSVSLNDWCVLLSTKCFPINWWNGGKKWKGSREVNLSLFLTLKYDGAGMMLWAFIGNFFVPLLCMHPVNVFCFASEYSGTILQANPCLPRSSRWNVLSIPDANNWPYLYSRYWTGTSLQLRLIQGIFSNANDIYLFLMILPCISLDCKLVPVQYREYEYGLFKHEII